MNKLWQFIRREDAATAVEYAVMLGLILLACMATVQILAHSVADSFDESGNAIDEIFNP